MDVITPGGNGIPADVRLRHSPASPMEAAFALEAWARRDAEHQAERDQLVRQAATLLVRDGKPNVRQIAMKSGLSRTTVYKILGTREG